MKRLVVAGAMAVAWAGLAGSALAGTPYPVKMKCPVGGESFVFTDTMSYSTWGRRPDGKPYGSWEFPKPIPECPGNRLVMFTEFSKAQVKALEPLLASTEYKALAGDTSYYRALWLAKALNLPDMSAPWLLLQASWQADGDAERKARYQREFVAAIDAEPVKAGDLTWLSMQARAVNAERELGAFDAATARIQRLRDQLQAPPADPKASQGDANERGGLASFLKLEEGAIARKDVSAEPLDLITPRIAAQKCIQAEDARETVSDLCKTTALADMIKRERDFKRSLATPATP